MVIFRLKGIKQSVDWVSVIPISLSSTLRSVAYQTNQLKRTNTPITPVATTNPTSILTTSGSSLGEVISCLSVALPFSVDILSPTNNVSRVAQGSQRLSSLKRRYVGKKVGKKRKKL